MKRSTCAIVGVVCAAIGAFAGYYADVEKEADVKEPILTSTGAETCVSDMQFHPIEDLQKSIVPATGDTLKGDTATGICIAWLLDSAKTLGDKQDYMHFIVATQNENGEWKALDPRLYRLYAEGYDAAGNLGAMEEFPPKIWP